MFVANDIADGKRRAVLLTVIGTKAYTDIVKKYSGTRKASNEGLLSISRSYVKSLGPEAHCDS